jgi:hypothetical protein
VAIGLGSCKQLDRDLLVDLDAGTLQERCGANALEPSHIPEAEEPHRPQTASRPSTVDSSGTRQSSHSSSPYGAHDDLWTIDQHLGAVLIL